MKTAEGNKFCDVFLIRPDISYESPASRWFLQDVKNSEYDQEIPQSQTADNPLAPRILFGLSYDVAVWEWNNAMQ